MAVVVNNLQTTVTVDEGLLALVQTVVETALAAEAVEPGAELGVALVDDEYIRDLNRRFRGLDRPTDVLAFPMGETEPADAGGEPGVLLLGDVVISLPSAARQAEEFGHTLEREVARLAVHGTLHLLGYDHDNETDAERMRAREDELLRRVEA